MARYFSPEWQQDLSPNGTEPLRRRDLRIVALTVRGAWDAPEERGALGASRSDASAWRQPNPEVARLRIRVLCPRASAIW
jgi:hypothetical protein